MVLQRRRRPRAGAVVWLPLVVLLAVGAVALTRPDGSPEITTPQPDRPVDAPATEPASPARAAAPAAGRSALVTVSVANVWNAPGVARPVDEPSVSNPVDIRRWIAAMSHEDKLWLVDRLVTQALYGERVVVREVAGGWARVVVTGQPSTLDADGYPGWIPVAQLRAGDVPPTAMSAVVTRPAAPLRDVADAGGPPVEVSFNTRLPVLAVGATEVTVVLPTGGRGLLATGDVHVAPPGPRTATSADLVASARLFSGLPYLWAGTSGAGFDCSGFTAAVYGVHGMVLPRDADDQAGVGAAVDRSRLQPGDLLFFSPSGEQRGITHVSMYVGNEMMIQAPATGRTVETVPVDSPPYARQYWGARRYLPAGPP